MNTLREKITATLHEPDSWMKAIIIIMDEVDKVNARLDALEKKGTPPLTKDRRNRNENQEQALAN